MLPKLRFKLRKGWSSKIERQNIADNFRNFRIPYRSCNRACNHNCYRNRARNRKNREKWHSAR